MKKTFTSHTDQILGVIIIILDAILTMTVLSHFNWSWKWFGSALFPIGIFFWAKKALIEIPIGNKGQLLLFKARIKNCVFEEGKRWIPWPCSLKPIDCRDTILELDPLEAFTEDNIKTTIYSTIVYRVSDVFTHLGVDPSKFKQGLDDVKDGLLREMISNHDSEEVIKMHSDFGAKAHEETKKAGKMWGIKVLKFTVKDVKTDKKVEEDLELKKREELQRKGQIVELQHFADRVKELMAPPPAGPGLSQEEAIRQVRIALGQLSPTESKQTFGLDPNAATAIAAILGRIVK